MKKEKKKFDLILAYLERLEATLIRKIVKTDQQKYKDAHKVLIDLYRVLGYLEIIK